MSENRLIDTIRQDRQLSKAWAKCTDEQKRRVLQDAEGDDWHLLAIIEDVLETK